MSNREALETKLVKIFNKFTLKEIVSNIIPLLSEITLKKIKSGLQAWKLKYTGGNVGKIVIHLLKEEKFESVRHLYNRINLLDVALHNTSSWIPCMLLNPITQTSIQTTEQMERLVLQALRIETLNADVYAVLIKSLIYVMVVNKKLTKKNGIKLTAPLYFVKSLKEPYIFLMNKQYPSTILPILIKAMGYENSKKQSRLVGKDINSLLLLLKKKVDAAEPEEIPFDVQIFKGQRMNLIVENEERLKHINHYLGEDKIILEELSVTGPPEFNGQYEDYLSKPFNTSMTIRAKDTEGFIRYMAWKGYMKPPFPTYIKKMNIIGKNKITLMPKNTTDLN